MVAQLKNTFVTIVRDKADPSVGVVHEFSREEYTFVEKRRGREFAVADAAVTVTYAEEGNTAETPMTEDSCP